MMVELELESAVVLSNINFLLLAAGNYKNIHLLFRSKLSTYKCSSHSCEELIFVSVGSSQSLCRFIIHDWERKEYKQLVTEVGFVVERSLPSSNVHLM